MTRKQHFAFGGLAALVAAMAGVPAAARAQIAVLSSTVEETTAGPGEKYNGTIVILNSSSKPQTARIYQTDYRFAPDGSTTFDEPGTTARSNASWITPQASQVVVPAGARVAVPYTVSVPAGDSLHGTYWSAVMVEGLSSNGTVASGKPGVSVGAVIRYAIQVATHMRAAGSRSAQFKNVGAVRAPDGSATLDLDFVDAGDQGFRPTLWIEVYDDQGALRAKARQVRGLLYPGTGLRQHFDLGRLGAGKYKALVFADTGGDSVFATQYTITY